MIVGVGIIAFRDPVESVRWHTESGKTKVRPLTFSLQRV